MTNPLEQIRELAEKWKYFHGRSDPYNAGVNDCGSELLTILDASQGYVCVPVETIKLAFDALHRSAPIMEVLRHIPGAQQLHHEAHQLMLAASKETNRE